MSTELELTDRLLTTFHLGVNERKLLTNNKVRFSIIEKIINDKLLNYCWYPEKWKLDSPFSGALIEARKDKKKFILHHKVEVSFMNYKVIEIIEFSKLDKAVLQFLKLTFGDAIDGIPIDYKL